MDELKRLIESLSKAVAEFQADIKARVASLEQRGTVDPLLEERIKKQAADIAGGMEQVEKLQAQLRAVEHAVALSAAPKPAAGAPKVYASIGDQLLDVYRMANPDVTSAQRAEAADRLKRVRAASGANEGIPSDGGFLVQQDFAGLLGETATATGILASRCFPIPISANANGLKANMLAETSRANGSRFGGIQVYWASEAGTVTASKPKFRQFELSLNKLFGLFYATEELLQDAAAMSAMVNRWFPLEFGFKIDDGIINGVGAGMPLGILNAGCLVSVAKETGQSAATVVTENLIKMYARLADASDPRAEWFANRDILPQLFTLSIAVGTGGTPIWLPANGLAGRPMMTLLGKPLTFIEQCQTLGTKGDIYLADLNEYGLASKGGIQSAVSMHVQFLYDEQTFRWTYRLDGQPFRSAALTPYKGSNTRSPFIALDTRS